ncbi:MULTISPECIES: hypothetical protein [Pseudomonas]|uniref:hypothetical protein n=1 Tax=Pseudomonas TaxID=286 RepID=UPI0018E0A2BB|nr:MULTISPECIES: hypothetical protein [Pseudomonas]MCM2363991.1 hypothetical protein [Pseudomonas sp. SR18]MDY0893493.1 hypothetical protein [Pseudomonas fluorescens]
MIPTPNPIDEPALFHEKCREKGREWLLQNPDKERPRDLWTAFKPLLAEGFSDRCAFGAMWIPDGTVDHFVSCNEDMTLAYEWSNYRYMSGWLNSSKNKTPAADLLDPFDVREGWFEVLLPSLQLVVTDEVPVAFREIARKTLASLPIRDDERLLKSRREWLKMYEDEELTLEGLRRKAPLIAAAIDKRAPPSNPVECPSPSRRQVRDAYEYACMSAQQKVRELIRGNGGANNNAHRWKLSVWAQADDSQVVATLIAMELATSTGANFCELSVGTVETSNHFARQAAIYAAEILSETLGPAFSANEPHE